MSFDSLSSCSALHICVPTDPNPDGSANLGILQDTVDRIAELERLGATIDFVNQRSTCPPGTADRLAIRLVHASYGANPSFLRKASIVADSENPERIAYGGPADFRRHMESVYAGLAGPVFTTSSRRTVELLKYVENALDSTLLSFWNEILLYARELNISADDFGGLLDRIGDRPKFSSAARVPGRAFGLWCLPKDLTALIHEMATVGSPTGTLEGAWHTNEAVKRLYGEGEFGSTELLSYVDGRCKLSSKGISQISKALVG